MEKLGIEVPLLLTQIVNFTIVLVVLTKLLYKPILKALKERRKKIEAGLAFAENAKLEEAKLVSREEEVLKKARDESRLIIEDAKKDGKKLKEEIIAEGKKEVAALKEKMEKEVEARFDQMATQLTAKTVMIAAEMVKRLLPDVVSDAAQHKLIQRELQKLEKRS